MSILENINIQIKQALLVAGFYHPIDDNGYSNLMLQDKYDWSKIKKNCKEIILINSDNDPWGCDDIQARIVMQKLNATLIIFSGQGHMGSDSFNQPYKEFPLLTKILS